MLAILAISLMIVPLACAPTPSPEDLKVVQFADSEIENYVRVAINRHEGPIYNNELLRITRINLPGTGSNNITDLRGLEYCVNVTNLFMDNNQISDITPLASMKKLTNLSLNFNRVRDLSPLVSLTQLKTLYLVDNQVKDLSALAGLTNLWDLILTGNRVTDISPLSYLKDIRNLGLSDNLITDIRPLVDNSGIGARDRVYLDGNPLNDISRTQYVPALEKRSVRVDQ